MTSTEVIRAWQLILSGRRPSLSIEITRECPLRCPGCYAYEDGHLGGEITLWQLVDYRGADLINGVLGLVDRYRPLHLSLVGGDPLVRHRELEVLVPQLVDRGIFVQIVTSAFRALPLTWASQLGLNVVVSIDGLRPEHDARRKPATYERILQNIEGQHVTVHCTITGQMMKRSGYLEEFLQFWAPRREIERIWMSLFTPQRGNDLPECLTLRERDTAVRELLDLRKHFHKLEMPESLLQAFLAPPRSPEECIFARTTHTISADFKTEVEPCQFGGDPDCSRCGCIASMGLAAIGNHKLGGVLPVDIIFRTSLRIGQLVAGTRANGDRECGQTLPACWRVHPTYGTALVKVMTRSTVNSLNPLRLSNEFLETGGEAGKIVRSPNDALPPGRFPAIGRIPSLNDFRPTISAARGSILPEEVDR